MPTNNNQPQTTTQIRVLFAESSYMNLRFYNQLLSISIYNRTGTDQNGKPLWDLGVMCTINYDQAVQLIEASKIFLKDPRKPVPVIVDIHRNECDIRFETKKVGDRFEATISLNRNGMNAGMTFNTITIKALNETTGQMEDVQIQTQYLSFIRVLQGYVDGVNSDRHLDKLTEEFIKTKTDQQDRGNQNGYNQNRNNQYPRNGYNQNRGNGNRRWNNGGGHNYRNNGYQN